MRDTPLIKSGSTFFSDSKSKGFSLFELMITISIAALLVGLALPAFDDFLANMNQSTAVNEKVGALNYARNLAMNKPTTITVNITDDDGDGDFDWVLKEGANIVKVFEAPDQAKFSVNHNGTSLITYESSGFRLITEAESKIDICNKVRETGKRITVSKSGRVSVSDIGDTEC